MRTIRLRSLLVALAIVLTCFVAPVLAEFQTSAKRGRGDRNFDVVIAENALSQLAEGRRTFREDTFGDEAFWGDTLRLHETVEQLPPSAAIGLGLKVNVDALPAPMLRDLKRGRVNLNDPAVTLALLRAKAVVGVTGFFDKKTGGLSSIGIQCSMCHSTVDNSVTYGVGHVLDGWPNRDLDVGKIIAAAPDLSAPAALLGVDQPTLRSVLNQWGPGKFDAAVFLDGKAINPHTGKPGATLIPPAYGLAGVNLHTWTGWGSVTHWNAFVANLEMRGKGTFFDPRLDDATQFPIAAREGFGHIRTSREEDRITPKLPALHLYQLAIPSPQPQPGRDFNATAARRGEPLFFGKAQCNNCHVAPIGTEPGWNLHTAAEIGIDDFQSNRGPDRRYRTAPLRGLFAHDLYAHPDHKGGFYHDGRFRTLRDVVDHYNAFFNLGLTDAEKNDLVEYVKSL